MLGLDALASASYGPEAALTILLIAGSDSSRGLLPITAWIIALLAVVSLSYLQTIAAYPNGGGSFTVAKENLGATAGLVAAGALSVDYILNVAVAISAGVGAIVSALPALLIKADAPLDFGSLAAPLGVIPLRRLDQDGRKALRFALTISPEVYVVQVRAEELDTDDLDRSWCELVEEPARVAGRTPPQLVVLPSPFRRFYELFLEWLHRLIDSQPNRHVVVLLPELVHRRWYQLLVSYRVRRLKADLLEQGGPRVSVMSTPWYAELKPVEAAALNRRR